MVRSRLLHWSILLLVLALVTLPSLGRHSLWDVDEGVNAEASREMLESGNWITPTFNYELRTAKPVMLYWLQMTSYSLLGVSEFAARLPSVLAAMLTILLVYELARRMFGSGVGLLSGLILGSCIEFCLLAHSASPDAVLLLYTVLTFFCFRMGSVDGRRSWFIPTGIAAGLAVLTKGPVGVALPGLVIFLYFLWNRELRRLRDARLIWGALAFLATALPWYILVTLETRGEWARQFFGNENLNRFMKPMENHSGPIFYHVLGLFVFFAPWCIFLGSTFWYAIRDARKPLPEVETSEATKIRDLRLLLCWFCAYLVFFSVAATKLPNYVLPLYPALAMLTAYLVTQWQAGLVTPRRWVMPVAVCGLAIVGIITGVGLFIAGGVIAAPKVRVLAGLDQLAWLGLIPLIGSLFAGWFLWSNQRNRLIASVTLSAITFIAAMGAFVPVMLDRHKAPRSLITEAQAFRPKEEVRLASMFYFHPSMVFYGQREVKKLSGLEQAIEFLSLPLPAYLFVTEPQWKEVSERVPAGWRIAARHFDFLKNCYVLVITNQDG